MSRQLTAQCPCGVKVSVNTAQGGMTLYGTLAWEMSQHEPCNALRPRNSNWVFDHGMEMEDMV